MADTVLTDVALHPHDEGLPNIADGNEDWNSAGLQMLLSQAVNSGSFARSDAELDFANHDATNDTVDVQPGVAYLSLAGETLTVQSERGGSSPPAYDTTVTAATMPALCVVVPTTTTVALQDNTPSEIWLAYATGGSVPGIDAGDVYIRSDDTGTVTAPPHPSVSLGTANPDDAGADTLLNRYGSPEFNQVLAQQIGDDSNRPDMFGDTIDANSVVTDGRNVTNLGSTAALNSDQTIGTGTASPTQVQFDDAEVEDDAAVDVDLNNNKLIAQLSGSYLISGQAVYDGSSNFSLGDSVISRALVGGDIETQSPNVHTGANGRMTVAMAPKMVEITSPPTDIIMKTSHNSGSDETLAGFDEFIYLTAIHLG